MRGCNKGEVAGILSRGYDGGGWSRLLNAALNAVMGVALVCFFMGGYGYGIRRAPGAEGIEWADASSHRATETLSNAT